MKAEEGVEEGESYALIIFFLFAIEKWWNNFKQRTPTMTQNPHRRAESAADSRLLFWHTSRRIIAWYIKCRKHNMNPI